jgi:tight adherence protein B
MPHQGLVASALRNGIPQIMPVAHMLLANKKVEHFFTCAQQVAAIRSYMTTPQALCSLCCAGVLFVAAAAAALTASVVLGLLVAFGLVLALGFMVAQVLEKRREALREAIPDALRSMSVCSHAGFSLLQTFQQVAKEADEPLRSLFLTAVHDLETGRTVSEALEAFRKNADVSELAFVAVALDIQHRAGGSLKQVLEAARDAVESELNLKRSLRVQTAQAKLSARIVSVMPFVLITIFSLLSPGFLTPFFGSLLGIVLLGLAASMQLAGIYLVRRLLDVKVD